MKVSFKLVIPDLEIPVFSTGIFSEVVKYLQKNPLYNFCEIRLILGGRPQQIERRELFCVVNTWTNQKIFEGTEFECWGHIDDWQIWNPWKPCPYEAIPLADWKNGKYKESLTAKIN